mmetsp:Transcript_10248/g.30361  ORF Transcript_10248/g.30361 Transcript_10248/m.30361 type:complete len:279 (+) Transcript_10248:960-1796(+)
MAREEAVGPPRVPTEGFHDEEVVQLIPLLREVELAHLGAAAPPAQRLVQVEHGNVGKVGYARHRLQEPEPRDGPPVVDHVEKLAEDLVGQHDPPRRGLEIGLAHLPHGAGLASQLLEEGPLPCATHFLPLGNGRVAQLELGQLVSQHEGGHVRHGATRIVVELGEQARVLEGLVEAAEHGPRSPCQACPSSGPAVLAHGRALAKARSAAERGELALKVAHGRPHAVGGHGRVAHVLAIVAARLVAVHISLRASAPPLSFAKQRVRRLVAREDALKLVE